MASGHTRTQPTYSPKTVNSSAYTRPNNTKSPLHRRAHPYPATCGARTQLTDKTGRPFTLTPPQHTTMASTSMTCGMPTETTVNSNGTQPPARSKSTHYAISYSTKSLAPTTAPPSGTRPTMDSPPGSKLNKLKPTTAAPHYHGSPSNAAHQAHRP